MQRQAVKEKPREIAVHHDDSPQDGSTWQNGRHALNYFLASLPNGSVVAENQGDDTFGLRPHGGRGPQLTCTVALSNDYLTLVTKLGDETWRASAKPDTRWQSDKTNQWISAEQMANAIVTKLSKSAAAQ